MLKGLAMISYFKFPFFLHLLEFVRSEPSLVPLIFELKQNENQGVGLWRDLVKLVNFVVWYPAERDYPRISFSFIN